VCLHKPGVYALNAPGRSPQAADTQQAIVYASKAVVALVSCARIAMLLIAIVLMTVKGLS